MILLIGNKFSRANEMEDLFKRRETYLKEPIPPTQTAFSNQKSTYENFPENFTYVLNGWSPGDLRCTTLSSYL